jgi:acetyl esterase/lipase
MSSSKNTKKKSQSTNQSASHWLFVRHKRLWKWIGGSILFLLLLAAAVWIAFQVSPWPNALLIRDAFTKGSDKVSEALEKHVPAGITQVENQQYRKGDNDAFIDVCYPSNTTAPRPTIVWVHGGAWVSGNKDQVDNYMKIVAGQGFTTVSVNYTIAPEKQYPTPIVQLNDALEYIQANAKRLNIDDSRIMMAGDSAGSQIVAQMANIATSPAYANEIGIQPKLPADKLKGLLLNCGAYDLALPDYSGSFGGFLHTVLWAYSGTKDFLRDPKLKTASVANYLTPKFPPSFITAGNVDPLLAQSTELAKRLEDLKVPTDTLFYSPGHQPQLNHEYQFNLDNTDGQQALDRMVEFAKQYTK